ncbi:hypothetical protein PR048_021173 [Dryococelus australis]|uniref:Uncharacterized protein n=1 Tax=Dryococelus australis TaxID=614101 RepID=A0ABQ9GXL5_9NEOP|nr:hypothetical protein PR048_021173 [Dryococelus australis]
MEQLRNARAGEKNRRPAASSGTILTCGNPGVTRPGIEPDSPWWEESSLTAQPPRPRQRNGLAALQYGDIYEAVSRAPRGRSANGYAYIKLGSPLVDDWPIMNDVMYKVVSGVVWTNRTMVSYNTNTSRTGVVAVVDIMKLRADFSMVLPSDISCSWASSCNSERPLLGLHFLIIGSELSSKCQISISSSVKLRADFSMILPSDISCSWASSCNSERPLLGLHFLIIGSEFSSKCQISISSSVKLRADFSRVLLSDISCSWASSCNSERPLLGLHFLIIGSEFSSKCQISISSSVKLRADFSRVLLSDISCSWASSFNSERPLLGLHFLIIGSEFSSKCQISISSSVKLRADFSMILPSDISCSWASSCNSERPLLGLHFLIIGSEFSIKIPLPPPLNLHPAILSGDRGADGCRFREVYVGGNTARLARRSDEALGVRVSVARIAPSLLDVGCAANIVILKELYPKIYALCIHTEVSRSFTPPPLFSLLLCPFQSNQSHACEWKRTAPTVGPPAVTQCSHVVVIENTCTSCPCSSSRTSTEPPADLTVALTPARTYNSVDERVSGQIWAALKIVVLRADEGEASAGIKRRGEREIREKTRRTAASSGTIPTCETPGVARPAGKCPTSHSAPVSLECLCGVIMIPWPAMFPDLSPVENVWDQIGRQVRPAATTADSEDQLRQLDEKGGEGGLVYVGGTRCESSVSTGRATSRFHLGVTPASSCQTFDAGRWTLPSPFSSPATLTRALCKVPYRRNCDRGFKGNAQLQISNASRSPLAMRKHCEGTSQGCGRATCFSREDPRRGYNPQRPMVLRGGFPFGIWPRVFAGRHFLTRLGRSELSNSHAECLRFAGRHPRHATVKLGQLQKWIGALVFRSTFCPGIFFANNRGGPGPRFNCLPATGWKEYRKKLRATGDYCQQWMMLRMGRGGGGAPRSLGCGDLPREPGEASNQPSFRHYRVGYLVRFAPAPCNCKI